MRYQEVIPAVFLERPNRFIALVLVNGQTNGYMSKILVAVGSC